MGSNFRKHIKNGILHIPPPLFNISPIHVLTETMIEYPHGQTLESSGKERNLELGIPNFES